MRKKPGPKIGKDGPTVQKSITVHEKQMSKAQRYMRKRGWTFSQTVREGLRRLLG